MAYYISRCSSTANEDCEKSVASFTVVYNVEADTKEELDPSLIVSGQVASGSNNPWQPNTAYNGGDLIQITVPTTGGPWVDNTSTTIAPGDYDASYPTSQTSGASFDEAELAKMTVVTSVEVLPACRDRYVAADGSIYLAFVKSRSIGNLKKTGNRFLRSVTVNYEEFQQEISGTNPGGGGGTTNDPLDFCPEIEPSLVAMEESHNMFYFLGYLPSVVNGPILPCAVNWEAPLVDIVNDCTAMAKNTYEALRTTADEPLSPIDRSFNALELAITFNRPTWEFDNYRCYIDTVNIADFTLDISCNRGFLYTFPKYSVWLRSVESKAAEAEIPVDGETQVLKYVKVTYNLVYNPRLWIMDIANRGVLRCLREGGVDHDGRGGTYGLPTGGHVGMAKNVGVNDAQGNIVNAPVWLDIDGQPTSEPSYLRYVSVPGRADFNDAQLKLVNWNTP